MFDDLIWGKIGQLVRNLIYTYIGVVERQLIQSDLLDSVLALVGN